MQFESTRIGLKDPLGCADRQPSRARSSSCNLSEKVFWSADFRPWTNGDHGFTHRFLIECVGLWSYRTCRCFMHTMSIFVCFHESIIVVTHRAGVLPHREWPRYASASCLLPHRILYALSAAQHAPWKGLFGDRRHTIQ